MVGQQRGTERFCVFQGSASFEGRVDATLFGGATFTLPAFPFTPGPAELEVRNHNSPPSARLQFQIPAQPQAPTLVPPSSAAPHQLVSLASRSFSGFSSVPELNVAVFSQGGRTVDIPVVAAPANQFSVFAPVPASFTPGPASVQLRSFLANGAAVSNTVSFTVLESPPAVLATAFLFLRPPFPTVTNVPFQANLFAPGATGIAVALGSSSGAFNPEPTRNRVVFRSGSLQFETIPYAVNPLATQILFTVPEAIPTGAATAQVMSQFGARSFARGSASQVLILPRQSIEVGRGDLQVAPAGKRFPNPLVARVTDARGAPVPNVPVYFLAPSGAPSGFFENGGGAALTVLTNGNGIADAGMFVARKSGGSYEVRAELGAQPGAGIFRLSNRNVAGERQVDLAGLSAAAIQTAATGAGARAGYFTASAISSSIAGFSIHSLRDGDGNLLTEAALASAAPATKQLLFLDTRAGALTAIAVTNPNSSPVSVTLTPRDSRGMPTATPVVWALAPGSRSSRFVHELFSTSVVPDGLGTLKVESSLPVALAALRERANDRREPVYSALPVAADASPATEEVAFPYFATGDGFRFAIVMMNPTDRPMSGRLRLFDRKGAPLGLAPITGIPYEIAGYGHFLFEPPAGSGALVAGYGVATAALGSGAPVGAVLATSWSGTTLISETAFIAAPPFLRAAVYLDTRSDPHSGWPPWR